MSDPDNISILSGRIDLGYLSRDISFMSRVLRAHIRWANAELAHENDSQSGRSALLSVIGLNPGISQNDLAATVVLKKSAVTKLISDMEAEQLVIREKPKADRRYNALRLSAEGEDKWRALKNEMFVRQEALLAPLNGREREKLFQLLGRLIVHYTDQLDGQEQATDTDS
ncbi:MarR family winged helix-turn-helix transcriptional regulator [Paracoccus albus]|uniref:MarR family winged helix-turn-helix transcriptional regulator n=1 Tax=Paracoccus albus TaxID=3017784 RepID=UPI0022F141C8|nr:MarR family winged helix-turn-helix transcriptional regulator [Paracoccus albus]WBU61478.1 MarR family winged helix-turn-helix transcriptional regulator [Paracoccus albus]